MNTEAAASWSCGVNFSALTQGSMLKVVCETRIYTECASVLVERIYLTLVMLSYVISQSRTVKIQTLNVSLEQNWKLLRNR